MKSIIKIFLIVCAMITFLFAGYAIGNDTQIKDYPYYTTCEGGTCAENWNYTCCLEYATGGCKVC